MLNPTFWSKKETKPPLFFRFKHSVFSIYTLVKSKKTDKRFAGLQLARAGFMAEGKA